MNASPPRPHVLVLDHAPELLDLLREIFEDAGYRVTLRRMDEVGPDAVTACDPDVLVTDLVARDGTPDLRRVRWLRSDPQTAGLPIVVCTGAIPFVRERSDELADLGVKVVPKPFDIDHLVAVVDRCVQDPVGFVTVLDGRGAVDHRTRRRTKVVPMQGEPGGLGWDYEVVIEL